jgi:adenylate kinase
MKIVLLGKPSSGKGTQAERLAETLKFKHISTGDLLREELKNNSKIGLEAKEYMDKGALVPDSLIINLLKLRLPKDNYILDGFPRTLVQGEELDKIVKLDYTIDIDCSDSLILKRIARRKVCSSCGRIYGLNVVPKKKDICDKCNGKLIKRADDNEETMRKRLKVYEEQTKPLIDFYKKKGIYFKINGEMQIEYVQRAIIEKIK